MTRAAGPWIWTLTRPLSEGGRLRDAELFAALAALTLFAQPHLLASDTLISVESAGQFYPRPTSTPCIDARTGSVLGTASALVIAMPEVVLGLGLERFTLLAHGDVYCVVDIVAQDAASIVLTALPSFPLDIDAEKARKFVAAWQQHAELQAQPYEVRHEQRAV